MKVSAEVLTSLNTCLGVELIAINQCFLHARMLGYWGYDALSAKIYHRSIEVMKLSDHLVQRIFLLEGLPNLQKLGKLFVGQTLPEVLHCDLTLEEQMRASFQEAILLCEQQEDFVSRELLVHHLDENEEYIDSLETEIKLLEELGLKNYAQFSV